MSIPERTHDVRVFVEFEGDLGLEGQPRAFENDFGAEFVSHGGEYNKIDTFH